MYAKKFMKKYIALSGVLFTAALFALSAKTDTVASSTAITIDTSTLNIPTMHPMPTPYIQKPEFTRQTHYLQITIPTRQPRPTQTDAPTSQPTLQPTVLSTATPTASAIPTSTSSPTPKASSIALTPTPTKTASPHPTTRPTQKPTVAPTAAPVIQENNSYTDQVIQLVNAERAKVGVPALSKNNALTQSAQNYAAYMGAQNFFSHDGKDGSTFVTRNKAAGYTNYRWMGENIAAGQKTPQEAMNAWMNSSGHKANILSSKAKEIGVGYATNDSSTYKRYWVQEFGAK
jgi:uncharacterized protein YkwD